MNRSTIIASLASLSLGLAGCAQDAATGTTESPASFTEVAQFNDKGELLLPENIEEWVFLGSSLGQRYEEVEFEPGSPGSFQVVRMEPSAYSEYQRTGKFPDGSMFSLSFYRAETDIPPNQAGFVMGELLGVEMHIRSKERFESGSGFYGFGDGKTGQLFDESHGCVACHSEHAGDDMVFDQFYPVIGD
jgi:hypothetical protein